MVVAYQNTMLKNLKVILGNESIVDGSVDIAEYARARFNWDEHVSKAKTLFEK